MAIIKAKFLKTYPIEVIVIYLNQYHCPTTLITIRIHLSPLANIAVLVGSVRRDRKGIRVARWIEKKTTRKKS